MGIGRNMLRATKGIALMAPLGLALSPITTLADTSTTTSFDAQYQQNSATETQLLQTAKALNLTTWQALTLQLKVQVLNQQISQLYAQEQQLVQAIAQAQAQANTNSSSQTAANAAKLTQLNNQRTQLLAELNTLWQQAFGTSSQPNVNAVTAKSKSHAAFDRANHGHGNGKAKNNQPAQNPNTTITQAFQALLAALGQANVKWLSSEGIQANFSANVEGHGHGKAEGHLSDSSKSLVHQIQKLINQIKQLEKQIAKLQSGQSAGNQGDDEDNHGQNTVAKLNEQLQKVQQQILHLQQQAIQDVQQWIALGGGNGSSGSGGSTGGTGTVAGLSVTSVGGTVLEGSTVQYTAQLLNASNQPVAQSGVKVDFSLVGSNNDGSLSSTWATTDANGKAVVNVVAGNTTGLVQVAAQVDSTTLPVGNGPAVHVVDASQYATHLISAGAALPTTLSLGQSTGSTLSVLPENNQNGAVVGDTLQVSTSNPAVLALPAPDAQGGNVQTLANGQYTLPALTSKSIGTATITVTDTTEVSHPTLSFTVNVTAAQPAGLEVVNPNGSKNVSTAVSAGVDGPFQIAVVDAGGNTVTTPSDIVLTAAQVNQIIGAGNGVRTSLSGSAVSTVVIPAGQSSVTVYADNVAAGNTNPVVLPLTNVVPVVVSAAVTDNHTVTLTFNEPLATAAPSVSDFTVGWGTGSATPQSVSVNGNTVTVSLWGTPLAHGSAVNVAYNPGSDQNALSSTYGVKVAAFNDTNVNNPL